MHRCEAFADHHQPHSILHLDVSEPDRTPPYASHTWGLCTVIRTLQLLHLAVYWVCFPDRLEVIMKGAIGSSIFKCSIPCVDVCNSTF
jgi:hypothetical protein